MNKLMILLLSCGLLIEGASAMERSSTPKFSSLRAIAEAAALFDGAGPAAGGGGDAEDGFDAEADFSLPMPVARPLSALARASDREEKNSLSDALGNPMAIIFLEAVKSGDSTLVSDWVDSHIKLFFISHALHVAVRAHNVEMVKYLLSKGAQKETQDVGGKTPLQLAQALFDKETQVQRRRQFQEIIALLK